LALKWEETSPSYTAAFRAGRSGTRLLARTSRSWTVPSWSRANAFNGNRYRAVADGSDNSRSTTGRLYTRLLPEAVGVAITVWEPDSIRFMAACWWEYSRSMPSSASSRDRSWANRAGDRA
jgi:hypothetical protein